MDDIVPNWRRAVASQDGVASLRVGETDVAPTIESVVQEIERRAVGRDIGRLQDVRKELKNKLRLPHNIFHPDTVRDNYAFHYGGRTELQFNIGFEPGDQLRHGVAFSLELSQTLPAIEPLIPKIQRYNEFLTLHPHEFADMVMWHWDGDRRIESEYSPSPIAPHLIRPGVFIFLGKLQPSNALDYDLILDDFDRLLVLYRFVEGSALFPELLREKTRSFRFKPGCAVKPTGTTASVATRQLSIDLRHNELQRSLHQSLVDLYGGDNVGTEIETAGGRIDVVVMRGEEYWFYEIKTAMSARGCIGEALSQLLEYSFWPGAQIAERLIVVGEPALDEESKSYLARLRERFNLPLEYQQLRLFCHS